MAKKKEIEYDNPLPIGDRIIVRPDKKEEETPGGIVLPKGAEVEKLNTGTCVAVGHGKWDQGVLIPMQTEVGDRITYSPYSTTAVKFGDNSYLVIREPDLLYIQKPKNGKEKS